MSQSSSEILVYEYPESVTEGWKSYPIRIVGPRTSRCHGQPTLLVQSMKGGFVSANCPECGGKDTFSESEFVNLGLWVSCPFCAERMVPQMVAKNYAFVCNSCSRYTKLAAMLPSWEELAVREAGL